ncbi:MAG: glycosyltransferase family 4 protein, partial [Acidimicrobiales bacterium]
MISTLLLAFNFPPHGGGIARMMGEVAQRYPAGSLLVSTGASDGSAATDAGLPQPVDRVGVRATRLRTINGLVGWTWRAHRLARRVRPGFVWCAELKPAGYPARWLRGFLDLPYGVVVHGTELLLLDTKMSRSRFKRRTAAWLLGDADVVVANSRWTGDLARRVLERLGRAGGGPPVEVVPLGTTPSVFRPGIDASGVRARHGLDGGPWLLTVARLEWHKGIDTVIRALPAIRRSHPGTRYAVAGVGDRRPQLERLVAELRLGDAVRLLGFVPDGDLPALYNGADLYVGVSRRHELLAEGFGISLVEASACGLPVVAGRSGGVPDAVRD